MANIIAQSKQADSSGFVDRKQLAADETKFCIENVKLVTQRDGKVRWYLTIFYKKDGELEVATLTFDRSPSRDRLFEAMNEAKDFPQHNCWVEKKEFRNKTSHMLQTFYDLNQEKSEIGCPCTDQGTDEDTEQDTEQSPDLIEHPF